MNPTPLHELLLQAIRRIDADDIRGALATVDGWLEEPLQLYYPHGNRWRTLDGPTDHEPDRNAAGTWIPIRRSGVEYGGLAGRFDSLSPPRREHLSALASLLGPVLERWLSKRLHEEADAVESLLHRTLLASKTGSWAWTVGSDSVDWAPEVGPIFGMPAGWEPSNYQEYADLIHPDCLPRLQALVTASLEDPSVVYFIQHRVIHPGGEVRWVECRGEVQRDEQGHPIRILGTTVDITARRELESQLLQAQKMEGIGRLAGGVAHDFNNLLTAIAGCGEALQSHVHEDGRRYLEAINRTVDRGASLTSQLLTFANKRSENPVAFDLGELLLGLSTLIERLIGEHIRVHVSLDRPPVIQMDPTQLEQVILNMAVNARDAMPDGGDLHITIREVRHAELGAAAQIRVSDTGTGFDPAIADRLFEPFFTTKGPSHGSGLGLASSYGIIAKAGGRITAENRPEGGACFEVLLPAHDGEAQPLGNSDGRLHTLPSNVRVLLVEDDPLVRAIARETMHLRGWQVETAATVHEAYAIVSRTDRFDIVVSDLMLPDGFGTALLPSIREHHPNSAVLFISGYAEDTLFQAASLPQSAVLQKPFTPSRLLQRIAFELGKTQRQPSA